MITCVCFTCGSNPCTWEGKEARKDEEKGGIREGLRCKLLKEHAWMDEKEKGDNEKRKEVKGDIEGTKKGRKERSEM